MLVSLIPADKCFPPRTKLFKERLINLALRIFFEDANFIISKDLTEVTIELARQPDTCSEAAAAYERYDC